VQATQREQVQSVAKDLNATCDMAATTGLSPMAVLPSSVPQALRKCAGLGHVHPSLTVLGFYPLDVVKVHHQV
jgi:hypothetical protein